MTNFLPFFLSSSSSEKVHIKICDGRGWGVELSEGFGVLVYLMKKYTNFFFSCIFLLLFAPFSPYIFFKQEKNTLENAYNTKKRRKLVLREFGGGECGGMGDEGW